MGRPKGSFNKKNDDIESKINLEVPMTEAQTLESMETEVDRVRVELEKAKQELKDLEERKEKARTMSSREVSEEEMVIVRKQVAGFAKNAGLKDIIEKQKAYDNVMVTGKFINRRSPGQQVKLTYLKYEDDPVKWYTFEDGKVYTIPRGFCDQLREHYHKPQFIQKSADQFVDPNKPESAISEVDTSNKIYDFVPINF